MILAYDTSGLVGSHFSTVCCDISWFKLEKTLECLNVFLGGLESSDECKPY